MKLPSRKELLRIELPLVDVWIPRVPWHDRGHPFPQPFRNDFGDNKRFLPPQFVGIAELESEHAEDVAGDVPGGLQVPTMRDLDDDAEAVRVFGMLDGEPEEAVGPLFGDNAAVAGLEDRRVEAIEAADQVGVLDHRPPDPVVVFFSNEI